MKIAVIGLGSMGRRRIRLVQQIYPHTVIYGVDAREDRRVYAEQELQIVCKKSTSCIADDIVCAFVCTAPLSHASIIHECLERGWHVFSELNLVSDGYEENMRLAKDNSCQLFLSSTFLYREEIRYIKSKVCFDQKWNYIYHIGQYLPDWHPWEDYKGFFIGDKRTSGCREIFAIELPWLVEVFGSIKETHVLSDKMTGLEIDYNDNYMVQVVHENNCKGLLAVDVVSPCAARKFEAYTEGSYIAWNGTPDSLVSFNVTTKELAPVILQEKEEHQEGYAAFVVENAYKNEIKAFFRSMAEGRRAAYGFEEDKKILDILDAIGV